MKILVLLHSATDSCSFYRAGGVLPELRKKIDVQILVVQWDQIELHWQRIIEFDLLFMQRPFTNEQASFVQFMKNFNIPVWVDYDDNVLEVPAENKHAFLYNDEVRANIKQILASADAVSVTTPHLKRVFDEHGCNCVVIPNAFNDFIFTKRELPRVPQKTALWRGSDSHIFDLMTVGDEFNILAKENPDWKYIFMGFFPWYYAEAKNVMSAPTMDVMLYFNRIRHLSPSVVFTPLADTSFNRCKSNIAWIEAIYAGAICVAPNFAEWQQKGTILYDRPANFPAAMHHAMFDVDIRKANTEAWDYIQENLLLSKVNNKRVELIQSLL